MTAGAFVLKLKRLDKMRLDQLAHLNAGQGAQKELSDLLLYCEQTLAHFADPKTRDDLAQVDQIYVPTAGLFAEAILGRSNSAEYLDMERYFNWQDLPIPNEAPPISPVGTESRFQHGDVTVTMPEGNLQVINPVTLPDPTGLQGALAAIQNPNLFRDMSKSAELAGMIGNLTALAGQWARWPAQ